MSLHVELSPEAQARLAAQRRTSTITSMIIAVLVILLVGIILTLFLLPSVEKFAPEIVSYHVPVENEETFTEQQITRKVQPKPSAPSSSIANVIAADIESSIAVPVSDTPVEIPSDFGDVDDWGGGWGDVLGDDGGGAVFFGQKVEVQRVVYVIDYSGSMRRDGRIRLLKTELTKSLKSISEGTDYQMIFFAGPAWLAGDKVEMEEDKSAAVVMSADTEYKWSCPSQKANDWKRLGRRQKAGWLSASSSQIDESIDAVKNTPLVWGTAWEDPLEMALNMDPRPDVIFFMTDGVTGRNSEEVARKMGARAKSRKIKLNAVAMMDPKAADAMKILTEASGGEFTMVTADGEVVKGEVNN